MACVRTVLTSAWQEVPFTGANLLLKASKSAEFNVNTSAPAATACGIVLCGDELPLQIKLADFTGTKLWARGSGTLTVME